MAERALEGDRVLLGIVVVEAVVRVTRRVERETVPRVRIPPSPQERESVLRDRPIRGGFVISDADYYL